MNWKVIEGYAGYEVSDTGLVRSFDRYVNSSHGAKRLVKGKEMRLCDNHKGYLMAWLSMNGRRKGHLVHRLVAEAFIPNSDGLPQINHLSGDKRDNRVENLAWTDARENALHAYQTGLNTNCGCAHKDAVPMINDRTEKLFCTIKMLCEHMGISYDRWKKALKGKATFPKWIDITEYSFVRYEC